MPEVLRPLYTASMLLAAAGYFAAGALAFSFQTAVLDALLWPAWFPV